MIREPIDFQELDVSVEDGVEAGVKRVHGRSILNKTKPNAVVYFDTVEDFDKAPDEPSVFDTIIDRLYSLKGEELRIVINGAVCSLLNAIDCLGRDAMEIFAKAWILDQLDERVDINPPGENDHWRWSKRFPRLSKLANANHDAFEIFRKAMAITNLPDLTKPQKTACQIAAEREAEFRSLRAEFEKRRHAARLTQNLLPRKLL